MESGLVTVQLFGLLRNSRSKLAASFSASVCSDRAGVMGACVICLCVVCIILSCMCLTVYAKDSFLCYSWFSCWLHINNLEVFLCVCQELQVRRGVCGHQQQVASWWHHRCLRESWENQERGTEYHPQWNDSTVTMFAHVAPPPLWPQRQGSTVFLPHFWLISVSHCKWGSLILLYQICTCLCSARWDLI